MEVLKNWKGPQGGSCGGSCFSLGLPQGPQPCSGTWGERRQGRLGGGWSGGHPVPQLCSVSQPRQGDGAWGFSITPGGEMRKVGAPGSTSPTYLLGFIVSFTHLSMHSKNIIGSYTTDTVLGNECAFTCVILFTPYKNPQGKYFPCL